MLSRGKEEEKEEEIKKKKKTGLQFVQAGVVIWDSSTIADLSCKYSTLILNQYY